MQRAGLIRAAVAVVALAAAPASAQDALAEWVFRSEGATAQLAVGGLGVGLISLTCPGGGAPIDVYVELVREPERERESVAVRLVSGPVRVLHAGKPSAAESGAAAVATQTPLESPLTDEFARTGALRVEAMGALAAPSPAPIDRVRQFLTACRTG